MQLHGPEIETFQDQKVYDDEVVTEHQAHSEEYSEVVVEHQNLVDAEVPEHTYSSRLRYIYLSIYLKNLQRKSTVFRNGIGMMKKCKKGSEIL